MSGAMSVSDSHLLFMRLSRNIKRAILVFADIVALLFSLWSAFALRFSEWWPTQYIEPSWPLFIFVPLFGVAVFIKLGLYRAVIRFMNVKVLQSIALGVTLVIAGTFAFTQVAGLDSVPRSVPIIFGLSAWLYLGGSRLLIRGYYHWLISRYTERERVIIYGAGGAGSQLAQLLQGGAEYIPIGFVDDEKALWKGQVQGLPVFNPATLSDLIENKSVDVLLLALPHISETRRSEILQFVAEFPVHVKTMPSMPEIIAGESLDHIREIEIEELLGRDQVAPEKSLIERSILGKTVCITGAGGSIGSELARQAVSSGAKAVVLYELSEFSLYSIEAELIQLARDTNPECSIYPILGSVQDHDRIEKVFVQFSVQTVYHAAAYKHVPLVEHNVLQGIQNNSLGTETVALAAKQVGVERFVLISTDKAVRPTNVMGATKRLAEMIIQLLASENNVSTNSASTIFSMVRFGNVLGSSGSVVPLFKKQIAAGGPVTVTHPDINRFFMTIPEAASLVIQAGSMAKGGDVFVLDMGEPVKIADLAKQMIRLSGQTIKDSDNPEGDIEVIYSGLRPGEKLYEELLIGNNAAGTCHPKIMTADEEYAPREQLDAVLSGINTAIAANDCAAVRDILIDIVKDFNPSSRNVDLLRRGQTDITNAIKIH